MLHKIKTVLIVSMALLSGAEGFAAFEFKGHGSGYLAGGSAGVALDQAHFGIFINPARLAENHGAALDLFYQNYYGISGLNQITLAGQGSVLRLPLGFGISRFGNKIYSETEIRIGSGYKIYDDVFFGFSLNTYRLEIQNYGSATGFGFDLAAQYFIQSDLIAGVVISNINEPKIGQVREKIPGYFALGLCYIPVADTEIIFDVVKDADFDFDYRFGINYHFREWLTLSSGFRDQVNSLSAGFSLKNNQFNLGYSFVYHPQLGGNNSISMGYAF